MKTHRSTLHVSMPEQAVPSEDSTGSARADSVGRTVRGIAILAILVGSTFGAEAAATSGHSGGHANALKMPTASVSKSVAKHHVISYRPWMY
jgi:hypothetical protein